MCEHIDKRFCIFKGLDSNRKSFAAIFIFGFCQLSQLSHFEQLNCSTISFYSHYDWILFFRIYFPTVGTPHWSECPVHAHSFWVLIIYVCIFFSVLILPNKAWHKDIKLVTNTIYSCVNPCKFNLHDTKAEVSVSMSINVRSDPPLTCGFAVMIHVADKGFVNKGECWTMTKMMKCFPKVSSLIEKKKKKKRWRGWFWLGDPSLAVNWQSNLYSPLYTLLATTDSSFSLKIMWSPKNNHLPWLKMLNVPQSHLIF